MSFSHQAYGLRIRSDLPIPGLLIHRKTGFDIRVWLTAPPAISLKFRDQNAELWYKSPYHDQDGNPTLQAWKLRGRSHYKLRYSDGIEFIVDALGNDVWGSWPSDMTVEDTAVYLLGPILGFVLRLRGTTCLHSSVICVDNRAVALAGPAGSGKSTTAAGFAKIGYSILADDVAALTEQGDSFTVQPAYPHLRLWPNSVSILYGHPGALPKLVPASLSWDKRYLSLSSNGNRFQQHPLPLAAIYILDERSDDPDAPFIEDMSPSHGTMALVANTYANYLLDRLLRAREFALLSRLASSIPLRRVVPHSDSALLPNLCQTILSDLRRIEVIQQRYLE